MALVCHTHATEQVGPLGSKHTAPPGRVRLDLNRFLVPDPTATRFVTVLDEAHHHRGIREGD